jgi:hypothetical protein
LQVCAVFLSYFAWQHRHFFVFWGLTVRSEFDKAEAPSSVKKAKPKQQQQQKQQQQRSSRDARAVKRGALAEDYFPLASDL